MLTYTISKKDRVLSGEIILTPSKTINNRTLVIRALKNSKFDMKSISKKDNVQLVDKDIRKGKVSLEQGEPAKAIRFLRAFFHYFSGEWIITGNAEMRKRPIGDVIEILKSQGFNIKYLEREGFPPLKIIAKGLKGNITRIDSEICSKFINASFQVSQVLPIDEAVELKNWIIKSPYESQTIRVLRYLGINTDWKKEETLFEYNLNEGGELSIEADWLSASYWYQMAALASKANFKIKGLKTDSLQGDAIVKEIFEPLGVKTTQDSDGVTLTKVKRKVNFFEYDFTHNPDLVPTMVATCVALKVPFKFTGIEVLRHKDVDRVMVLQSQMGKLGAKLVFDKFGQFETLSFDGQANIPASGSMVFNSFSDQRIVMSLAPLSILGLQITIDDPKVVSKSYPCYWRDYKKVNIDIDQSVQ